MTRTVVVTGIAGGIGAAVASAFHDDGWRVVGLDRLTPSSGIPADRFHKLDFADLDAVAAGLDVVRSEPRVDALVNNAGTAMDKAFAEVTVADWRRTMDVNVGSAFLLTQHLLPKLQAVGGAVVNVASVHAVATSPGAAAYAASKGALVALTRAVALEVACHGVRVNAILPGAIDTPMLRAGITRQDPSADVEAALVALAKRTPLGTIGQPAQIAEGVLFLADSRRSGFVTGQALIVDGGATAQLSTEVT